MKVHPWAAATAAFAAGSLAAVGIAQATSAPTKIPDSSTGTITACFVKKTGAVRFINAQAGKLCKTGEKKVTFNQKGPQGSTGATGATGATGPSNSYAAALSGTKTITQLTLLGGSNTIVSLNLPAGSYIINASTTGTATNGVTDRISCEILASGGTVTGAPVFVTNGLASLQPADSYVFATTASYKNTADGTVRYSCVPIKTGGISGGAGEMTGGSITAIRTADLTVQ